MLVYGVLLTCRRFTLKTDDTVLAVCLTMAAFFSGEIIQKRATKIDFINPEF